MLHPKTVLCPLLQPWRHSFPLHTNEMEGSCASYSYHVCSHLGGGVVHSPSWVRAIYLPRATVTVQAVVTQYQGKLRSSGHFPARVRDLVHWAWQQPPLLCRESRGDNPASIFCPGIGHKSVSRRDSSTISKCSLLKVCHLISPPLFCFDFAIDEYPLLKVL